MSRADELQIHPSWWYSPTSDVCYATEALRIIRDLEATIATRDAQIAELEAIVGELRVQLGSFGSQLAKAIEESRAIFTREITALVETARAEVPEWCRWIIQTLVDQRDNGHAEPTDLLVGVSDAQLIACGIEVP